MNGANSGKLNAAHPLDLPMLAGASSTKRYFMFMAGMGMSELKMSH